MTSILDVIRPSLISTLPQIVIAVVGLVLVHTRLRRSHPNAYFYGTFGLVLLLANGALGVAISAYARANDGNNDNGVVLAKHLTLANLVGFVVLAVSLILIFVALLADRGSEKTKRVAPLALSPGMD